MATPTDTLTIMVTPTLTATERLKTGSTSTSSYDSKHEKTLDKLVEEIRKRIDFIGVEWADEESSGDEEEKKEDNREKREVREALAPYTTQCVGIDLSENMVRPLPGAELASEANKHAWLTGRNQVATYNARAANQDPPLAARRLVERLRPGSGVLMILDFLPHEKMDASHPASGTVIHHGFSKEQIQKIFEDAGAGEHFAFEELAVVFNKAAGTREEMKRKIFMARGTRRAE
ncbi:uncharacterized protein PODANS_1_20920 [Podospora anserina S mat+]|uniref:Podospora anserina S mat+ genomic DNA chromosome 1, supercontig 5 n=1 Tax=Podospora anserina (strain S / ATCC MYA-4624 / DSM 980 / FGSC 10383) TaxID=515849 RepID=B2ABF5_PODAN|nr:uncharacterized protein PODANS_1_20920 [Podospora anserina S mat+]CAP60821.1 unnamed protein product [Podospora anserina S mat+]